MHYYSILSQCFMSIHAEGPRRQYRNGSNFKLQTNWTYRTFFLPIRFVTLLWKRLINTAIQKVTKINSFIYSNKNANLEVFILFLERQYYKHQNSLDIKPIFFSRLGSQQNKTKDDVNSQNLMAVKYPSYESWVEL